MAAASAPPNYDNVRWGGPDGLRIPQEAGIATLAVDQLITVNGNGSSAVTLNSSQVNASVLVVGSMSSTTNNVVTFPAAFPGQVYCVKNSSGSSCTFKVTGQTGVAVANGSHAVLVGSATDIEQWTASF